jgi:hypothetical protein
VRTVVMLLEMDLEATNAKTKHVPAVAITLTPSDMLPNALLISPGSTSPVPSPGTMLRTSRAYSRSCSVARSLSSRDSSSGVC